MIDYSQLLFNPTCFPMNAEIPTRVVVKKEKKKKASPGYRGLISASIKRAIEICQIAKQSFAQSTNESAATNYTSSATPIAEPPPTKSSDIPCETRASLKSLLEPSSLCLPIIPILVDLSHRESLLALGGRRRHKGREKAG